MRARLILLFVAVLLSSCGGAVGSEAPGSGTGGSSSSGGSFSNGDATIAPNCNAGCLCYLTPDACPVGCYPHYVQNPGFQQIFLCGNAPILGQGGGGSTSGVPGTGGGQLVPVNHRSTSAMCSEQGDAGGLCSQDSDCPNNEACFCVTSQTGICISGGNCRIDSDCGPGGFCSPSVFASGSAPPWSFGDGFYCHTSQDSCLNDSDCGDGNMCAYNLTGKEWECTRFVIVL